MRKLFLVLMLAAGTLTFQSCKKDDEKKVANEFKYDDGTMKIASAIKDTDVDAEMGEGEEWVYEHEVYFLSEGLTATTNSISGEGDVVALELYSSEESEDLTPGTYNIGEDYAPFVVYMMLYIDYNGEGIGAQHAAESGTIKIEKDGDTYTFTVDVIVDGKSFKGNYKGALAPYTPLK